MIYSSAAIANLVYSSVPSEEQRSMDGRFSTAVPASEVPSTSPSHLGNQFIKANATTQSRIACITMAKQIVFVNKTLGLIQVLSNPKCSLLDEDPDGELYVVGGMSDKVKDAVPGGIRLADLCRDVQVPFPRESEPELEHIKGAFAFNEEVPGPDGVALGIYENMDATIFKTVPDGAEDLVLARVPVCLPVPAGHSLDSAKITDADKAENFHQAAATISPVHDLWVSSLYLSAVHFGGKAMNTAGINAPEEFRPDASPSIELAEEIGVEVINLDPESEAFRLVADSISQDREKNREKWVEINKDKVDAIMAKVLGTTVPNQVGTPPGNPTVASTPVAPRTSKERLDESRVDKAKAIYKLMLAFESPTNEGTIVLGEPSDFLTGLFPSANSPRPVLPDIQLELRTYMEKRSACVTDVLAYKTAFPVGAVGPMFVTSLLSGKFTTVPIHEVDSVGGAGTGLSIFNYLQATTASARYKEAVENNKTTVRQAMLGESDINSTKMSLSIFSGGEQWSHEDVLAALANTHGMLTFLGQPQVPGAPSSFISEAIRDIFGIMAHPKVEAVFNMAADLKHVAHAVLADIQGLLAEHAAFATSAANITAVITGQAVDFSNFERLKLLKAQLQRRLVDNFRMGQFQQYKDPPASWKVFIKNKEDEGTKTQEKQKGKSGKTPGSGGGSVERRSNPDMGDLVFTGPSTQRPPPLRLSGDRPLLCLDWAFIGKSCPKGSSCNMAHKIYPNMGSAENKTAMENYVANNRLIEWAPRHRNSPGRQATPAGNGGNSGRRG